MTRILVVEDEEHLAEGLRFNLEAEGYRVEIAETGPAAVEALAAGGSADLVILDLMLPGFSGFEVLDRVRASGSVVPVLVLTAVDSAGDRVRGLEAGADDYLVKPFHLDELLARVRGLLRRRRWDGVNAAAPAPAPVSIGAARLRAERFELETPNGTVELTTRELGLLRALVERGGDVATRGELLEEVWGLKPDTHTRVVDSFVVRLRRYLEPDPARPRHLLSVRGRGYKLLR